MIITKLKGGLGNQMFQYAFGRHLSLQNTDQLLLDCEFFKNKKHKIKRYFSLNIFNIETKIASTKQINSVIGKKGYKDKLLTALGMAKKSKYLVQEQSMKFDKNILSLKPPVYLDGYWQSEKYFIDIEDTIRSDFTFKPNLSRQNQTILDDINKTNSVSIHVRRGDYVSDKQTSEFHGACSIDYYKKAIDLVFEKVKHPKWFVFSDDMKWAKTNIKPKGKVEYINNNTGNKSFEDMRLMSHCKHNIIANSSFSWWGAWLNNNSNKIIFAPKKWFASKKLSDHDIIPSSWIKI